MKTLYSETEIARAVERLAKEIGARRPLPELAVPVLTGAFIFAADLVRALNRYGLDLAVDFVSLSRYGRARSGADDVVIRMGASEAVRGRHALLVDGVLDEGLTLLAARNLLIEAGAASVATVVAVDKMRAGAALKSDYAAFSQIDAFLVGYGMDDAGRLRGLPYIGCVD